MKHYTIAKTNYNKELVVINYDKLDGFKVTPKGGMNYPGVKVNSLVIVKPSFIEKVLKKKVRIKLDYYLKYLISIVDEDDSTDARKALNDLTRYKEIVEYKYRKYLDDRYINVLLKKIAVLERELKAKAVYQKIRQEKILDETPVYEERIGKSR